MTNKLKSFPWRQSLEKVPLWVRLVVLVVAVSAGFFSRFYRPESPSFNWSDQPMATLVVDQRQLTVEVAATPEKTIQGLSNRTEIGSDGMLFLFEPDQVVTFWMKEMQFGLDLVWIRDGRVTGVELYVPKPLPDQPESSLPRYRSPGKVDMVLEVPAGQAQKWNLWPGQTIQVGP